MNLNYIVYNLKTKKIIRRFDYMGKEFYALLDSNPDYNWINENHNHSKSILEMLVC